MLLTGYFSNGTILFAEFMTSNANLSRYPFNQNV